MSMTLVVMLNATNPHLSGKWARTTLCNSVGDLSSLSTADGLLGPHSTCL
jgi:hypothetical protein